MAVISPRIFLPALIMAAFCWVSPVSAQEPASLDLPIIEASATDELKAKEGQKVIVYGVTAESGKSPSGTNLVNFKGAEFYLITFKSDLEPFKGGEPADLFDGKRVAVTGVITIYRNKPQIKLTSLDQVRVLNEGEKFPPEKPKETGDASGEKSESLAVASADTPEKIEPEKPKETPPVDWRKFFK